MTATPDATALLVGDRRITYAEFSARVAVLARQLRRLGVGPDDAVGLCIPRSAEMVVAIHAVIAAGGQYVPIDTGAPADRVEYMVSTARVGVVIVAGTVPPSIAALERIRCVEVDCDGPFDPATPALTDATVSAPSGPTTPSTPCSPRAPPGARRVSP